MVKIKVEIKMKIKIKIKIDLLDRKIYIANTYNGPTIKYAYGL